VRRDLPGSCFEPLLKGDNHGEPEDIHAVYVDQSAHLPTRLRCFGGFWSGA
jgi:hypothetical protein